MYEYILHYIRVICIYHQQNFPEYFIAYSWYLTSKVVRENSQYFAKSPLIFPQNDAWGMPAEIPYQRRVTTQISIVLLIGCAVTEICFNQSEALPRSGYWRISAVTSLLGHHFVGKPVVATQYLGSFLSLYLQGNNTKLTVLPVWPPWAAQWRGVEPDLSRPLTDTCQVIK